MSKLDSTNRSFFLKVISDYLAKRQTETVDGVDWKLMLDYSATHHLEGLFFYQCRNIIPAELRSALTVSGLLRLKDSKEKENAFKEVEKAFTAENVPFVIVKGLEAASLYPTPSVRYMCDMDMLFHSEDRDRAKNILVSLGFTSENVGIYEWKFRRGNTLIELHNHLQYENVTGDNNFAYTENVWEHVLPNEGTSRQSLDWNFHLVFLLLHLQKHFVNGEVEIRSFIDIALVCKNEKIDAKLLKSDLIGLGIYDFAAICFAFCSRWFDIKMPFCADIDEGFYNISTENLLENGFYGSNVDKNEKYVLTRIKAQGVSGAIQGRYFPKLKYMKEDPRFGYLKKYPVLLPIAWFTRFAYAFKAGKFSEESSRVTKFFASKDKMNEYDRMLSDWGINNEKKEN